MFIYSYYIKSLFLFLFVLFNIYQNHYNLFLDHCFYHRKRNHRNLNMNKLFHYHIHISYIIIIYGYICLAKIAFATFAKVCHILPPATTVQPQFLSKGNKNTILWQKSIKYQFHKLLIISILPPPIRFFRIYLDIFKKNTYFCPRKSLFIN